MKIVCTKEQYQRLHTQFLNYADQSKIWGFCPLAFEYCSEIPCGKITSEMCRNCMTEHIEWEVTNETDNAPTVAINKDFYKTDKSNPINRSDLFQ